MPTTEVSGFPSTHHPAQFGVRTTATNDCQHHVARLGWDRTGDRHRRRAVVLDQDPNVLEILGQLLGDEDYEVTLSVQRLEKNELARLEPDVIVADTAFNAGEDGYCLYNEPLMRADGGEIPIVYSTTEPEVAARLLEREIPILLKPFDLETFLALVNQADS